MKDDDAPLLDHKKRIPVDLADHHLHTFKKSLQLALNHPGASLWSRRAGALPQVTPLTVAVLCQDDGDTLVYKVEHLVMTHLTRQ